MCIKCEKNEEQSEININVLIIFNDLAPCEGIVCGPHAFCKLDGPETFCVCEDGWSYDPKNITAGCMDIDECDKSHGPNGMCGDGALCSNTKGAYSCSCPPGFSGNAEKACADIDECKRPNTCGVGATCTNNPGNYDCSCPDGTIADPDPKVKCTEIIKCGRNDDCPGNAFCDQSGRQCLCPEPNVGADCRRKYSN